MPRLLTCEEQDEGNGCLGVGPQEVPSSWPGIRPGAFETGSKSSSLLLVEKQQQHKVQVGVSAQMVSTTFSSALK